MKIVWVLSEPGTPDEQLVTTPERKKMKITPRQAEARRANGKLSHGPKTEAGKAALLHERPQVRILRPRPAAARRI